MIDECWIGKSRRSYLGFLFLWYRRSCGSMYFLLFYLGFESLDFLLRNFLSGSNGSFFWVSGLFFFLGWYRRRCNSLLCISSSTDDTQECDLDEHHPIGDTSDPPVSRFEHIEYLTIYIESRIIQMRDHMVTETIHQLFEK